MTDFATTKMHHATRAKATKIAAMLAAEYPRVSLETITEDTDHADFDGALTGWSILFDGEEVGELDAKGLELDAVLDQVTEAGFDPQAPADDEADEEEEEGEGVSRSAVSEKYKVLYAEISENGRNCGDWLASFINGQCLTGSAKNPTLNIDHFATLLRNNGIDLSGAKWASAYHYGGGSRGWQGRFRMSGRVVLEKTICQNMGTVIGVNADIPYQMPADALAALNAKHAKALGLLKKGAVAPVAA